jgi:hypothetical protein
MAVNKVQSLFLTAILLIAITATAQNELSKNDTTSTLDKVELRDKKLNDKIDNAQSKINQATNPNFKTLLSKTGTKKDSIHSDSLKHPNQKLDSLKGNLNYKIDSLKSLHLPKEKYDHLVDSLQQAGTYKQIKGTEAKLNSLQQKVNQPIDKAENAVNEKLTLMNKEGGQGANLPGNVDLPEIDAKTNLNVDHSKLNVDGLKAENPMSKMDNPIKDQIGEVNEVKGKVSELKSTPQEQINKVTSIEEVQKAKESLGKVNEITDKAQSYQGDVKNIADGKMGEVKELPKTLENQATKLDEVKDFQKQSGALGQYTALTDEDKARQMLMQQAKDQMMVEAKNHFAGKEQVLQQAMDKMSKLKRKYPEIKSLNDSLRRSPNSLKGKPFRERVIPGITLQIQKEAIWVIDYNPWLAYRLNKRCNIGFGWNERFGISKKWFSATTANRIYGPRVFAELVIKKGFSARTEIEKMNSEIPSQTTLTNIDAHGRAWVWSLFVGVKKQYTFVKNVKGNFQFLYNIYDDHYSSPYIQRFNTRFGFEFPVKKRK